MPDKPARRGPRFSPLFYNWISYAGAWLTFFIFLVEAFLFGIDFYAHSGNLYLGLLTYVALPPFLILGLLMIPAGALIKRQRVRAGKTTLAPAAFRIDMALPHHRNSVLVFLTVVAVFLVMSLIGAYKGFHYTESVEFCGVLCHQVMKPEHTAYLHGPHARVKCVECHIGAGADWYVRSKLSGARQVLRTISKTYDKPIKTPVHNLRPAPETCEQCHWPDKFFGTRDFRRTYHLTEGDNDPRWHMRMLLNIGGGDQETGVHTRMNFEHNIYYAAEDERRQQITWVKAIRRDGKEIVYTSPDSKFKETPPPPSAIRKMDCMDCHNRPAHQFRAPYRLVNDLLTRGEIDSSIPEIKQKAMDVLAKKYATTDEAMRQIPAALAGYYSEKHGTFYQENREKIASAADRLKEVFVLNFFPEMKARWDAFPDNIGHLVSPGCFRCHDGEHRSAEGKIITRDCNTCHSIVEQGPPTQLERSIDGVPFKHPNDDDNWKEMNCSDCHTGANP